MHQTWPLNAGDACESVLGEILVIFAVIVCVYFPCFNFNILFLFCLQQPVEARALVRHAIKIIFSLYIYFSPECRQS